MASYILTADRQALLEALQERYEAGDGFAVFEALELLKPTRRGPARTVLEGTEYPPMPPWLEHAIRSRLAYAWRMGEDSIRRAFGVTVASGTDTLKQHFGKLRRELLALGCVRGIQDARKGTLMPYPRGQDADSLAGLLLLSNGEPTAGGRVKRWAKAARDSGGADLYRHKVAAVALHVHCRVLACGCYPPFEGPT